jgi:hypothetical protein
MNTRREATLERQQWRRRSRTISSQLGICAQPAYDSIQRLQHFRLPRSKPAPEKHGVLRCRLHMPGRSSINFVKQKNLI